MQGPQRCKAWPSEMKGSKKKFIMRYRAPKQNAILKSYTAPGQQGD